MSVLLTHGYFLSEDEKELKILKPYPPLGILYLSAYLKKNHIPCKVLDSTFLSKEEYFRFIRTDKPKFLCIYVNLMTKINVVEIIRKVKSDPELKGTRVILGGPEVTYHADKFIEAGADFVIIGEGEETLYDLISTIETPFNPFLDQVHGIVFRNALGDIVHTAERTKIKEIDKLPFPDREAINLSQYLETWKNAHGRSMISVSTMRGCPYTCKWCSRAVYGLSYRRRSPELVVKELKSLTERYHPDSFWFVDDVFTISHVWLNEFKDELAKAELKISFECITRADRLNEEVIQALKETGCFRVWIGAESGSQRVLDLMDRRVDANKVREMILLAKQYGIEAGTFIMLGYPGETESDIEETIHHLVTSDPDEFTITIAYPITGTPFFEEVKSALIGTPEWETSTDRQLKFKRPYSDQYYNYAVRRVTNEVNFHKNRKKGSYLKALGNKLRVWTAKRGMAKEKRHGF